jgi:hypothetical protein
VTVSLCEVLGSRGMAAPDVIQFMVRSPPRARYGAAVGVGALRDVIAEPILHAMRLASRRLSALGVRHALVGALAAGTWGEPRATKDVDFLVGREWLQQKDPASAPGLASEIVFTLLDVERETGVGVDAFVVAAPPPGARPSLLRAIERALRRPFKSEGLPIAPVGIVIATKLLRGKAQDEADIVSLLRPGRLDRAKLRRFLREHLEARPVARFDELARRARAEQAAAKKTERVIGRKAQGKISRSR